MIDYWDSVVLTPELREQIARNPRAQMYMDSLELSTYGAGGLFWGRTVAEEFRTRRGYDIAPWLPFLTRTVPMMAVDTIYHHEPRDEHRITVEKVRFDYVRTLTDLYIENMLRPFATFLHDNGMTLRSEISYGLPFELTRPGPEVDGIETESLEFGVPDRRLPAAGRSGAPVRQAVLLRDRRDHPQPHARPPVLRPDHRHPTGRRHHQDRAARLGQHRRRRGRHRVARTRGHVVDVLRAVRHPAAGRRSSTRCGPPPWVATSASSARESPGSTSGSCAPTTSPTTCSSPALFDEDGDRIPDEDAYGRLWMRNRENQWWQDLGMQDAGWTYEFFDGSLLLHDEVSFADGLVQPNGPGYQALIVYQSELDADVAAHLLDWARQGLKVLVVHGTRELKLLLRGLHTSHERAAVRTPGLDGRDEELAATMAELLALPTVAAIDDPAETVAALRDLGVAGRAEFVGENAQRAEPPARGR